MEVIWPLCRYSRIYSDYQLQSFDITGKISLFPYFSQNSFNGGLSQPSQLVNTGFWSTINATTTRCIYLNLKIISEKSCQLEVIMKVIYQEWEVEAARKSGREASLIGINGILLVSTLNKSISYLFKGKTFFSSKF
jgi:hypothetical protein